MTALELARWQFTITTVFHFLFVPVSIGLSGLVAWMQTRWYRSGDPVDLRMTRFWGKLLLIVFAVGVVTGLVQEFQFGMNWSDYSRYVGDVFGAPLAIEGLAAFFLESTFLGLWLFGWGRLPPKIHLATIWLVAIGTTLSAFFILAANSWMQQPVGTTVNPDAGRAEMDSIWELFTNPTLLFAFPHTILAAFATAGMLVLGVSAFHLLRGTHVDVFLRSARIALVVSTVAVIGTMVVGHFQAQHMTEVQPMKMAAAEALYESEDGAGLSLAAVAAWERAPEKLGVDVRVPGVLAFMATDSFNGRVKGINEIQRDYESTYGEGDYRPIIGVTYWTFRLMVGAGFAMLAIGIWGLWLWRRGTLERSRWFAYAALAGIALPFLANSAGWIFTEVGRQPWVVQGLLLTEDADSPSVATAQVVTTLVGFTLVYGVLAVIAAWLFARFAKHGPPDDGPPSVEGEARPDLTMAY